jgi:hypothetical protein
MLGKILFVVPFFVILSAAKDPDGEYAEKARGSFVGQALL